MNREWYVDLGDRLPRHEDGMPILVVGGPCDQQRIQPPALRHARVQLMVDEPHPPYVIAPYRYDAKSNTYVYMGI